ncbi:hypothetical protein BOX37_15460 [Nocardia mangyaensis]|uniref:Uncharacterized protein n=1 Tax=Nocardia mangyaensis TaxID=2213200 RepID=A0A1J0VSU0_9NOCA|nr:hypothetical protein [Nocardia mangyaensis]APE35112.1 hypothetical protein BOX37_15460 [Nocardia mangyaensis]
MTSLTLDRSTFDVHDPATGAVVGTYPNHDETAVAAAVAPSPLALTTITRSARIDTVVDRGVSALPARIG